MGKGPETEFQDQIVSAANQLGWHAVHFRRAQVRQGRYATPIAYDGKGYPDLTLFHPKGYILFVEVKAKYRKLEPEQKVWAERLDTCIANLGTDRVAYFVVDPRQWDDVVAILTSVRK